MESRFDSKFGQEIVSSSDSRLVLGSTEFLVQRVQGANSPGYNCRSVKLATRPYLASRLGVRVGIPLVTHASSFRGT